MYRVAGADDGRYGCRVMRGLAWGSLMGDIAFKILIGVATAAVWFALSHAASAAPICGNGISAYLEHQAVGPGR